MGPVSKALVFPQLSEPDSQYRYDAYVSQATFKGLGCEHKKDYVIAEWDNDTPLSDSPGVLLRAVPVATVCDGHVLVSSSIMETLGLGFASVIKIRPVSPQASQRATSVSLKTVERDGHGLDLTTARRLLKTVHATGPGLHLVIDGPSGSTVHCVVDSVDPGGAEVQTINSDTEIELTAMEAEADEAVGTISLEAYEVDAFSAHGAILRELEDTASVALKALGGAVLSPLVQHPMLRPRGLLLSGPKGVGKTFILNVMAKRALEWAHVVHLHGVELIQQLSEHLGRFPQGLMGSPATEPGDRSMPILLLVDDLDDLLAGDDDDDEGSGAAWLVTLRDSLESCNRQVFAIFATRQSVGAPGAAGGSSKLLGLQSSLLYDRVLEVPPPDASARAAILSSLMRELVGDEAPDAAGLAKATSRIVESTAGFVAHDLVELCRVAAMIALKRADSDGYPLSSARVLPEDLLHARRMTVPTQLVGLDAGADLAASLSWDCVGGYEEVKTRLRQLIQWPWQHREAFQRLGLSKTPGIVLHGPSGCGKSLIAEVIAAESRATFVRVHATDIMSPFLGESEARLRGVFTRARRTCPCILFLDELDAMAASRDDGGSGEAGGSSSSVYSRVLSTLLNEMDGISGTASGVVVLAATNRLQAVDSALLRPGRLQEAVLVPLPDPERDYLSIMQVWTRHMPLDEDVNLQALVRQVLVPGAKTWRAHLRGPEFGGPTPADLMGLCREAGLEALRESFGSSRVARRHFLGACRLLGWPNVPKE